MALDKSDVAIVKGMLARGDRQSDISAWFGGENGGRISEINTGKKHSEVAAASQDQLPPPGPYNVSVRSAMKARQTLEALRDLIAQSLDEIAVWEKRSKED